MPARERNDSGRPDDGINTYLPQFMGLAMVHAGTVGADDRLAGMSRRPMARPPSAQLAAHSAQAGSSRNSGGWSVMTLVSP